MSQTIAGIVIPTMDSQYLRHAHRRLLSRATTRVAEGRGGEVVLITGPEVAGRRRALTSVAALLAGHTVHRVSLLPWHHDEPGALLSLLPSPLIDATVVIDDLHHADPQSLRAVVDTARRADAGVSVIGGVDTRELDHLATEVIQLPPLTLTETAGYLLATTGRRIPVATVERIHAESEGWPGRIDDIVAAVPDGHLARPVDDTRDHLTIAQSLAAEVELPAAELYLNEVPAGTRPGEQHSLRGYLALYRGLRRRAHEYLDAPGDDPGHRTRAVLLAMADWDLHTMQRRATEAGTDEARILGLVADAALTGRLPDLDLSPERPVDRQRLDMVHGWLSLSFDDPLTAREKFQHHPGQSPAVGLWQDAWLARTLYVLGEWSTAARIVERGLAAADTHRMALLEPMLLWSGVQIATMQGDDMLARQYLQRLTLSEDAFLLQSLPAAMGRMIVAANSADLPTAVRAGGSLARIVAATDTQHPGFWPWEDVYAQTLIRAGRIDAAVEIITGAEERHTPSGLVSLMAKNAVPRATIQFQRGDVAGGLRTFEEAAEAILATPMPAYQSRILFEYGKVLRRHGRRQRADEVLAHAAEIFAQMGAGVMVDRCAAERRVGGVGPETRINPHGFTPQEEQIAALVAEGGTNRAVARELSLSTKTVEYHLTRIYRKLGVTTRQALREGLAQG